MTHNEIRDTVNKRISIEIFIYQRSHSFLLLTFFETVSHWITLYIIQSLQKENKKRERERSLRNLSVSISSLLSQRNSTLCTKNSWETAGFGCGMKGGSSGESSAINIFICPRFGSVRLGSARLGSTRLCSAPMTEVYEGRKEPSSRDIVHGRGRLDN